MQRLGLLETSRGDLEDARERLSAALATARASDSPMVRCHSTGRILATLAFNRLEAGELASAAEYVAQGFGTQQEVGECPSCDVLLYPAAVPVSIALGDLRQAEWACGRAEDTASAFGSRAWSATARFLRGQLAAAQGDHERAVASFEAALATFQALAQPYDIARTLEALARLGVDAPGTAAAGGRAKPERSVAEGAGKDRSLG
jgi:tetratricopeptide (TPR) repeat protein